MEYFSEKKNTHAHKHTQANVHTKERNDLTICFCFTTNTCDDDYKVISHRLISESHPVISAFICLAVIGGAGISELLLLLLRFFLVAKKVNSGRVESITGSNKQQQLNWCTL